jgi:HK97 family phage major capsid protein
VGRVSDAIQERMGRAPRSFYLPFDLIVRESRALDTTAGAGAIPSIFKEDQFIDVLRSKLVLSLMGARIAQIAPERGTVTVPRIASSTVPGEVAEGSDLGGQSNLTAEPVTFTPHDISAWTDVTRTMISSSFGSFTQFVLEDQARALAVRMDAIGLNGSGSNTPKGLLNTTSIPTSNMGGTGGAPTRAALLAVEKTVGLALGDQGADASLAWCTTPAARTKLRATDGSSAGSGKWLWSNRNEILGFPAFSTSNMPANGTLGGGSSQSSLIYGDWRALWINIFGDAVDVLVDPYTYSGQGIVRLTSYLAIDVQVAHLGSFCCIKDLVTA